MSEHPIESMMGTTLDKIKEMADVNTVVGDPITTADGTVIIPFPKSATALLPAALTCPPRPSPTGSFSAEVLARASPFLRWPFCPSTREMCACFSWTPSTVP